MVKNAITVKNLTKKYKSGKDVAVDNISFEVPYGEFFALLGPNGAGKTTTISILTTTLSKTSGEVTIAGHDIDKGASQVRQNIGIIFQNPSLDLNLTAEENVRFHAILYGLYPFRPSYSLMPKSYKSRIAELSEVLGIGKEMFQPVKTFSGGMKRKLEIVRSLMHNPKILFLDEPTSGLDPLSRKTLWNYLQTIQKKEKTTVFLTTHYLEEAENADRVCVIKDGKVLALTTPSKLKKEILTTKVKLETKFPKKLTAELTKLKINIEKPNQFEFYIEHSHVQKLLQSIKTTLTGIEVINPRLEDAYIELLERKS